MSYDVSKVAEGLENELWRHSSLSNPSAGLPTSQLILQPFSCFTYVIVTSPTSPGEPHMPLRWCLICSWWFCNLEWLRPAGLYKRYKFTLELKTLKTHVLSSVNKYLQGDSVDLPQEISPEFVSSYKYCSMTSVDVERSFSAYKHILTNRRHKFTRNTWGRSSKATTDRITDSRITYNIGNTWT